jgi:UDP-N-acetyl-D-galactosamine dehydrogenase
MNRRISVIGLGYGGLPVATTFAGTGATVVAFDIDARRIAELAKGHDRTGEVTAAALSAKGLNFTTRTADLRQADFHIVTVPTPIDASKQPNLAPYALPRRLSAPRSRMAT